MVLEREFDALPDALKEKQPAGWDDDDVFPPSEEEGEAEPGLEDDPPPFGIFDQL